MLQKTYILDKKTLFFFPIQSNKKFIQTIKINKYNLV